MLIAWNHMLRCTYFFSFSFFFPSLSQVFLTFQAPMVYKQIPKSILTYNPVIRNQVNNNSWCFTDFLLKIEGTWVGQMPISLHHLQGYLNSTYTTQPIPLPTQLCRDAFSLWWDSVHQKLSKRFPLLILCYSEAQSVQQFKGMKVSKMPIYLLNFTAPMQPPMNRIHVHQQATTWAQMARLLITTDYVLLAQDFCTPLTTRYACNAPW